MTEENKFKPIDSEPLYNDGIGYVTLYDASHANESEEQRIKSLEAQLANTEQLTCDGCKYFTKERNCIANKMHYLLCIRHTFELDLIDGYTEKDTQ